MKEARKGKTLEPVRSAPNSEDGAYILTGSSYDKEETKTRATEPGKSSISRVMALKEVV